MPAQGPLQVEGLDELIVAFAQLDADLRRELSTRLRSLAGVVATDARAIALAKGLKRSGDLIAGIKTQVKGTTAWVIETARRVSPKYPEGYRYPAIYEFGGGRRKSTDPAWFRAPGIRAFMTPAVDKDREQVFNGIQGLVDDLIARHNLG
jgi:hypothetical protein